LEPVARKLGAFDVFCVAAGAMISSGLFVLPAIVYGYAGPSIIVAYGLASILVIPAMLSEIELASAMPKAGGSYFFIERSMGQILGLFGGFGAWFAIALKSAFALVGLAAMGVALIAMVIGRPLTDAEFTFALRGLSALFCLAFMALNVRSVKHTGRFQTALVVVLLLILLAFTAYGWRYMAAEHFAPFFHKAGILPILAVAGTVFVSFGGLTTTTTIAEEVENPARTLPMGMFSAWFVVSLLYIAVVAVTVGVTEGAALSASLKPIELAARSILGWPGAAIVGAAAFAAFVTTANGGLLTASRIPMAMSRDDLLPGRLSRVHPRLGTPISSVLLTGGFVIAALLALDVERLVKTASTLLIMTFILENAAVIVMRASRLQSYRPKFRSPLYPWLHTLAIVVYIVLIIDMGFVPLLVAGTFIAVSTLWYFIYVASRVRRYSALKHIIERVTDKTLITPTLDTELREILFERDNITQDRFDALIENCIILDLPERRSADSVFTEMAELLAARLSAPSGELLAKLKEREAEGSTVIQKGLAIPHVVIEGQNKFEILIVRSREGIDFPGSPHPVHAIFTLAGSKDERNYHLRALMAIAQIAQEKRFEEQWLQARDASSLRNLILLAKRRRDAR
jgi:APA family basic amino acid/polyamine antiporter